MTDDIPFGTLVLDGPAGSMGIPADPPPNPPSAEDAYERAVDSVVKSVLRTLTTKNNEFHVTALVMNGRSDMVRILHYRIVLNGREITGHVAFSVQELYHAKDTAALVADHVVADIARAVAKAISGELVHELKCLVDGRDYRNKYGLYQGES